MYHLDVMPVGINILHWDVAGVTKLKQREVHELAATLAALGQRSTGVTPQHNPPRPAASLSCWPHMKF